MNIRFVAVDDNGREIEDDNEDLHPPITQLTSDTIGHLQRMQVSGYEHQRPDKPGRLPC